MHKPLQYNVLAQNEFRLCTIQPGSFDDDLDCTLSVHTLTPQQAPIFEALSYVWGLPEPSHFLKCRFQDDPATEDAAAEGQEGRLSGFLDIGPNLKSALLRLRRTDAPRKIWIDAICINQLNNLERGCQVQMMGLIYSKAASVCIWLGEEDEETENAIAFIKLLNAWSSLPAIKTFPDSRADRRPWPAVPGTDVDVPAEVWLAFENLLLREWFDRGWVFQEAVLGPKLIVLLGSRAFEWTELKQSCQVVFKFRNYMSRYKTAGTGREDLNLRVLSIEHTRRVINAARMNTPFAQKEISMQWLLINRRGCITKDPRDKIFCLLGILLICGSATEGIKADYNISVRELYSTVLAKLFSDYEHTHKHEPLLFLGWVQDTTKANDLPSWVPDWSRTLDIIPLTSHDIPRLFNASRGHQGNVCWDNIDSGYLKLQGVRLMSIKTLGTPFTKIQTAGGPHAGEAQQMLSRLPPKYPVLSMSYRKAYALAMNPFSPDLKFISNDRKFWDFVENYETEAQNIIQPEERDERPFWSELNADKIFVPCVGHQFPHLHRRFFVSESGFMGLAPAKAEPGDIVCILFRGKVPYVLRKSGKMWKYVGECAVLGVMYGEAMADLDEERVETFVLE